jgi:hypothetical protein
LFIPIESYNPESPKIAFIMKNQPTALLFGTCLTVAGMMLSPGQGMANTLTDNGSSVNINLSGANPGMNWWNVPGSGQNQLDLQWFWYSVNGGSVQSIDTIGAPSVTPLGANSLIVTYSNPQISIQLEYVLSGTGIGSASIAESIAVDNNTVTPFSLNLFEYSNFNLLQSGNNTATVFGDPINGYSQATQNSGGTAISQSISSPFANYAEAGLGGSGFGTVLNDVTSGSNLNGTPSFGPGNAAWAFQWSTSVPGQPGEFDELGNGSLSITNVPEPTTFALIGLGLGAAGLLRRRRSS